MDQSYTNEDLQLMMPRHNTVKGKKKKHRSHRQGQSEASLASRPIRRRIDSPQAESQHVTHHIASHLHPRLDHADLTLGQDMIHYHISHTNVSNCFSLTQILFAAPLYLDTWLARQLLRHACTRASLGEYSELNRLSAWPLSQFVTECTMDTAYMGLFYPFCISKTRHGVRTAKQSRHPRRHAAI